MRIGTIIGTVTLCRWHPLLGGGRLHVAVPKSLADLRGESSEAAEEFVLYDELGAGNGALVAITEGAEAAQPFHPETKPIDAYCAAILDNLDVKK